jgi:drug/metabolite transporter (DMT)-like permease
VPAAGRSMLAAELAAVFVMLTWAGNVVAVKAVLADVPPILFAWSRFTSAFLLMLAFLWWREGHVGLPRRDVLPMLVLGLLGYGIYQDMWATALGQTTAANSALITASAPVPTILIAAAVGSDTLSARKLIGAAIALAGAAGVVLATHGIGLSGASLGDLLTFAATICWALYIAFGAPVLARHSPLRTATWAMGFGTLGMLPLALWQAGSFEPSRIQPGDVALFLYSMLLPAAVSGVIIFESMKVLGPARAILFQFLVPVFAIVFAAFFLGEVIVAGQLIGGAVIVFGILVARSTSRGPLRRRPALPSAASSRAEAS